MKENQRTAKEIKGDPKEIEGDQRKAKEIKGQQRKSKEIQRKSKELKGYHRKSKETFGMTSNTIFAKGFFAFINQRPLIINALY